jgi:hypothetical protein
VRELAPSPQLFCTSYIYKGIYNKNLITLQTPPPLSWDAYGSIAGKELNIWILPMLPKVSCIFEKVLKIWLMCYYGKKMPHEI